MYLRLLRVLVASQHTPQCSARQSSRSIISPQKVLPHNMAFLTHALEDASLRLEQFQRGIQLRNPAPIHNTNSIIMYDRL